MPREMPKAISRSEKRRALMLRQRKPSRQSSRMLTERMSLYAISGRIRG